MQDGLQFTIGLAPGLPVYDERETLRLAEAERQRWEAFEAAEAAEAAEEAAKREAEIEAEIEAEFAELRARARELGLEKWVTP